jgi:hypothetical protein
MSNLRESLSKEMAIDGAIGAALIDFVSGVCLGSRGGREIDMELAGAAITEVIRTKKQTLTNVGVDEDIDEIIVELEGQYHLIQAFEHSDGIFSYLILDKANSSLPLARMHLRAIDRELVLEEKEGPGRQQ